MRSNSRIQLRQDIVNAVYEATTDPERGCVPNQQELADLVQCSKATITAEMKAAVSLSTEMFPGECLDYNWYDGYRIVDIQTIDDMIYSRGRWRKAFSALERGINEIDVRNAGPVAKAAVTIAVAALGLLRGALETLSELIDA